MSERSPLLLSAGMRLKRTVTILALRVHALLFRGLCLRSIPRFSWVFSYGPDVLKNHVD